MDPLHMQTLPSPGAASAQSRAQAIGQKLEAHFLEEMLKQSGVGKAARGLGSGAGQDEFGTFLRRAYASEMGQSGGMGLAELVTESLLKQENS